MTFERGELLLVPFPFSDLSASKRRPVVALTAPDSFGDFVGLPVTTRPHHAQAVPISTADLVTGSLPAASWVRIDRVVTLNGELVTRSVARLSEPFVQALVIRLCAVLGRT